MSLTILIVRHAQSANNAKSKVEGGEVGREADPGITALGVEQAQLLADYLKERRDDSTSPLRVDRILSSPMVRTLETVRPVCAALGLPADIVADLHEQGGLFTGSRQIATPETKYPMIPGLNDDELRQRFPFVGTIEGVGEAGWWRGGYEAHPDSCARAWRVVELFKALAAKSDGETILVMTHGCFLEILVKALLGMNLPNSAQDFGPIYMPTYCTSIATLRLVAPTPDHPDWAVGLLDWNTLPHLRHHPRLWFGSSRGPIAC